MLHCGAFFSVHHPVHRKDPSDTQKKKSPKLSASIIACRNPAGRHHRRRQPPGCCHTLDFFHPPRFFPLERNLETHHSTGISKKVAYTRSYLLSTQSPPPSHPYHSPSRPPRTFSSHRSAVRNNTNPSISPSPLSHAPLPRGLR